MPLALIRTLAAQVFMQAMDILKQGAQSGAIAEIYVRSDEVYKGTNKKTHRMMPRSTNELNTFE